MYKGNRKQVKFNGLEVSRRDGKMKHRMIVFESTSDAMDMASADGHQRSEYSYKSSRGTSSGFYHFENFGECMRSFHRGWDEGVSELDKMSASIKSVGSLGSMNIAFDMHGDQFCMGRVMEGNPECWMQAYIDENVRRGGKIKRIAVSASASACNSTETLMRRGVVIASMVDALETLGYRCEVHVFMGSSYPSQKIKQTVSVVVKSAHETVNKHSLAFALVNPDFFRRVGFGVWEYMNKHYNWHLEWGYGQPLDAKYALKAFEASEYFDAEMRAQVGNLSAFTNDEKAKKEFTRMMKPYMELEYD